MRFDLVTLNLVLAVAEGKSITAGAEREHLALAAASRRLSDIETRLGVKLFQRKARGVELTDAGHALVRHVRSLHAALHALESEVVEFSRGIKGHLRVAANAGAIAECLSADLAAFSKANPGIRISLEDLSSAEVQAAVAEGRADVGVFVPPLRDDRLTTYPYRDAALRAIVPADHLLASRSEVDFDALLGHDIVGLPIGTSVHQLMLDHAKQHGRVLQARLQVRGFDAIAQLVEAGLGVALLPAAVAERLTRSFHVKVLHLNESWAQRQYMVAARTQNVQPAAVQRFLDALGLSAPTPVVPRKVKPKHETI
ncbi:MAG: LysR family transcriptional regulator [Burkholderiales bacterium]